LLRSFGARNDSNLDSNEFRDLEKNLPLN